MNFDADDSSIIMTKVLWDRVDSDEMFKNPQQSHHNNVHATFIFSSNWKEFCTSFKMQLQISKIFKDFNFF